MYNFLSPSIELFKIKCNSAYNQIKIILKKSNIQQRKLTKQELKEINGGKQDILSKRLLYDSRN
ncbi:hypothetical protein EG347_14745 [Chryseobacterium sp. G0186]|nr:hypothetical protein EG347_14745 [Chryseobacterium sp. G0186]